MSLKIEEFVEKYKSINPPIVQGLFEEENRKGHGLYESCKKVTQNDYLYVKDVLGIMHRTMMERDGIGLAANQVGLNLQIFMIEAKAAQEHPRYKNLQEVPYQVFINPMIKKVSDERDSYWHACLSAQNCVLGKVGNYRWIEYEAMGQLLNPITGRISGMGAIIFQHEFRHLLGGLYLDYAREFLTREDLIEKVQDSDFEVHSYDDSECPLLLSDYKVGSTIEE